MRVSQCVHALDPSICSCESVAYGKGTVPCLCHCTHLLFTGTSPSVCPWQPANLPNDADALPPCHLVLGMPHKAFRVHTQTNKNTTLHRSGFFHTFVIAPSHLSTIVLEALGLYIYIYTFFTLSFLSLSQTHTCWWWQFGTVFEKTVFKPVVHTTQCCETRLPDTLRHYPTHTHSSITTDHFLPRMFIQSSKKSVVSCHITRNYQEQCWQFDLNIADYLWGT